MHRTIMKLLGLLFGIMLLAASMGCGGGGSNKFFKVHTTAVVNGLTQNDPGVSVGGFVPTGPPQLVVPSRDCGVNPSGKLGFGPNTTDSNGNYTQSDPAEGPNCLWLFNRDISPLCPVQTFNQQEFITQDGMGVPLQCQASVNTFIAQPNKLDPTAPPATVTITGNSMSATYAMPKVDIDDSSYTVHLEVTALSASPDGTTLVIPANQITFSGHFAAVIYVMQSDGSWKAIGGADLIVLVPPPPPPKCRPPMPCC